MKTSNERLVARSGLSAPILFGRWQAERHDTAARARDKFWLRDIVVL
jgi:hypothetical protein